MQLSSLPASVLLQIWIAALLTLYPLPSQSFTRRSVSSGVGPAISTVTCNWKSPTASVRRTDHHCHHHHHPRHHRPLWSTANQESDENPSSSSSSTTMTYSPIFDFAAPDQMAVNKFERIDDAIMGGISLSSLKQLSPEEDFARWSGICRLDGGYVRYDTMFYTNIGQRSGYGTHRLSAIFQRLYDSTTLWLLVLHGWQRILWDANTSISRANSGR